MSGGRGGFPPPEELMWVRRYLRGGAVIVSVSGEVDVLTAPRLRRELDAAFHDAGVGPVVVDLTDVSFLASRGLATLVDAHRDASAMTPLRVVVDDTRPVIRPLQLTGLDGVLTLFNYVEEALEGEPEATLPE
ncbi:MAG: STAS domain-containing protein [Pseudonocardia sp.]